jgi:membrane associated rhomboid family serine protease
MIPISDDNPTDRTPFITWILIAVCVAVYGWEFSLGDKGMDAALAVFGFLPGTLAHPELAPSAPYGIPAWGTIFTAMFLHGGLLHLGGNMLYLWIFGNNIEEAMGHVKYTLFYFACGIGAALTMMLLGASDIPMVGASGAISGVLGAYMLLYPRARVHVIIPLGIIFYPLWIRAVWVVGIWFALQLVSAALTDPTQPGTAFWAHVGGFAAGVALTPVLKSHGVRYFGPYLQRGPWN